MTRGVIVIVCAVLVLPGNVFLLSGVKKRETEIQTATCLHKDTSAYSMSLTFDSQSVATVNTRSTEVDRVYRQGGAVCKPEAGGPGLNLTFTFAWERSGFLDAHFGKLMCSESNLDGKSFFSPTVQQVPATHWEWTQQLDTEGTKPPPPLTVQCRHRHRHRHRHGHRHGHRHRHRHRHLRPYTIPGNGKEEEEEGEEKKKKEEEEGEDTTSADGSMRCFTRRHEDGERFQGDGPVLYRSARTVDGTHMMIYVLLVPLSLNWSCHVTESGGVVSSGLSLSTSASPSASGGCVWSGGAVGRGVVVAVIVVCVQSLDIVSWRKLF